MLIDCRSCPVAARACADCSVGALLGMPAIPAQRRHEVSLDAAERRALQAFVAAGLVHPEDAADVVATLDADAIAV